jgi:carbamoyl-phosphate synthase large subunit
MSEVTILVTAIGGSGHGEQILKAAREIESLRIRIVGTDVRHDAHQFSWVDVAAKLPPANHSEYTDELVALCLQHQVAAVFHGSEPEMHRISNDRERLESAGVVPIMNSKSVIDLCTDKVKISAFLEDRGFNPPQFQILNEVASLDEVDLYPVVIKPYRSSGGSAHVYIAQNKTELRALRDYLSSSAPASLMIQEYVGTPESEFTVGILSKLSGGSVSGVALRRDLSASLSVRTKIPNQTGRSELGSNLVVSSGVSQGWFDLYPDIVKQCREVADSLDSRGAINFQCRIDDRGVRIFEVNPRLSGTTSVRSIQGYNEVEYLIRSAVLNEANPPLPHIRPGRVERGLVEFPL